MNFMANKKLFFAKNSVKKKLKQSKLDGFLKSPAPSRSVKASRNAMLQEFFLGTVGQPKKKTRNSKCNNSNETAETTFSSAENNSNMESRVVIAITEGRSNARGEVGIAAIDVNAPELILCQLSDDMWYSGTIIKIQMLNPVEVLLPITFFNAKTSNSKLLSIMRSTFPTVDFKATPRKHFHDFEALERIEKISTTNIDDVKIALENKYYALAACNALLSYVGIAYYMNFAEKSLKVIYESRYAAMTIDMETSKRLELVSPLSPTNEKRTCLYSFMDHCMTRIGKRSLRARILEPFADHQMINQCHVAISELLEKENYQCTLRMVLKKFYQVDRLMKLSLVTSLEDSVKASETMINLTLMLKNCLATIPMLMDLLSALDSPVFVGIRAGLEDSRYQLVLDHIDHILNTNEPSQHVNQTIFAQRINAVKPNVDQVLDLSRSFYSKLIDEIAALAKEMSSEYELSFQLIYSASKGYQLSLTKNRTNLTYPDELVVVSRKGNKIVFTTDKLIDLNARLKRIVSEILMTSNKIISGMLMSIRQEIDVVYLLTGIITELDLIQCFASLSRNDEFTRPLFGQETRMVDAVHPFLEFGRLRTQPVPNQVIATPDHNVFVITGPNMGGKTVYIKMIAVLQVMAQVGCFIPAADVQLRICDKLFSRIGFEDNIDKGISSFGMEVEQMSFILNNVTPNSLVIIDELGRGTNPGEGQEWAWQMCEQLAKLKGLQNDGQFYVDDTTRVEQNGSSTIIETVRRPLKCISSPFIYLTTHFLELTKLSDKFHNVANLCLVAEENVVNGAVQLTYTHRVQVGVTAVKEYGLALARTVKFPRKIIPKAENILQKIKDQRVSELINSSDRETSINSETWTKEKLMYDLYASVATICRRGALLGQSGRDGDEIRQILRDFGGKCSQDLRDSIRNLTLEDTFNQSRLFTKKKGSDESASQMELQESVSRVIEEDEEEIPETPHSSLTQESIKSRDSNSTFMSGVDVLGCSTDDKNRTNLSRLSYHSLIKRMAEKAKPGGFPIQKKEPRIVIPLVKENLKKIVDFPRPGGATGNLMKKKEPNNIGRRDMNFMRERVECHSPEVFDYREKATLREMEEEFEESITAAGGDNELTGGLGQKKSQILESPEKMRKSFFNDTIADLDLPWETFTQDDTQDGRNGFLFDSPEKKDKSREFFDESLGGEKAAPLFDDNHTSKFQMKNGKRIPCTATSNRDDKLTSQADAPEDFFDTTFKGSSSQNSSFGDYDFFAPTQRRTEHSQINCSQTQNQFDSFDSTFNMDEDDDDTKEDSEEINLNPTLDSPDTIDLEREFLNSLGEEGEDDFSGQTTQEIHIPRENNNVQPRTSLDNSNYNFRLGLLDLHKRNQKRTDNDESNEKTPSVNERSHPRPHEFIAKYGKIIEENYKRTQSQPRLQSVSHSEQDSQNVVREFREKYGSVLKERNVFKQPPVRFAVPQKPRPIQKMTQRVSSELNCSMQSPLSSIRSPGPSPPPEKRDYSEWLSQYCRSRVKSLGVPAVNRKRPHNSSSVRSARSKMHIESVNKKWESYYTNSNLNMSSSGSDMASGSMAKRVSFGGREYSYQE